VDWKVVFAVINFDTPPLSVVEICPECREWVFWAGDQIKQRIIGSVELLGTL
jgi:hypothetical protein